MNYDLKIEDFETDGDPYELLLASECDKSGKRRRLYQVTHIVNGVANVEYTVELVDTMDKFKKLDYSVKPTLIDAINYYNNL